jgi:hypothetical protein
MAGGGAPVVRFFEGAGDRFAVGVGVACLVVLGRAGFRDAGADTLTLALVAPRLLAVVFFPDAFVDGRRAGLAGAPATFRRTFRRSRLAARGRVFVAGRDARAEPCCLRPVDFFRPAEARVRFGRLVVVDVRAAFRPAARVALRLAIADPFVRAQSGGASF